MSAKKKRRGRKGTLRPLRKSLRLCGKKLPPLLDIRSAGFPALIQHQKGKLAYATNS